MEFTGERFIPGQGGAQIAYEHLLRYVLASETVAGKRVLDLGSGEGYGAFLLAQSAQEVVGVDIDPESIAYSAAKYPAGNLSFVQGSVLEVPIAGEHLFDVITCYEVIEHVAEAERVVAESKRLLRTDGLLFVSTPNKKVYSDEPMATNPFHIREFYFPEFRDLLHKYFRRVLIYGQHLAFGSALWNLSGDASTTRIKEQFVRMEPANLVPFQRTEARWQEPMYFVAVCSDHQLPKKLVYRSVYLNDQSRIMWAEFESARAEWGQAVETMRQDLEGARLQTETIEADRNQLQARAAALDADRFRLEAQVSTLEAEREQAKSSLQTLEEERASWQEQARSLRREQEHLRGLLRSSETQRQDLVDALEADRTHVQNLVQKLKTELAVRQQEAEGYRRAQQEASEKLHAIEGSVAWKIVIRYRTVIDRLLPSGTLRRRAYGRLVTATADAYGAARVSGEGVIGMVPRLLRNLLDASRVLVQEIRARIDGRFRSRGLPIAEIESRAPVPPHTATADVIICVHNALADVQRCLESVIQHTAQPYSVILVDDGSTAETRDHLSSFATTHGTVLLRNDAARGYTRAANQGLRQSSADYVVLLNSDTLVSPGWLDRLIACAESDAQIGIVGPLSNTASWQSIPDIQTQGDWTANPLPAGMTLEDMGDLVARYSARLYPSIPFLNGFCLLIRRQVIQQLGIFDEERYGAGYGEENDYCLRARSAGWKLAVADDAYVYHAQSRSYSHEDRKRLGDAAMTTLVRSHGQQIIDEGVAYCRSNRVLEGIRARSRGMATRRQLLAEGRARFSGRKVLFLLPIAAPGGGGNVVLMEAKALRAMDVQVEVFNLDGHRDGFQRGYSALELPVLYGDPLDVATYAKGYDAVIATAWQSAEWLRPLVLNNGAPVCGYYIQDFEPYFYPPDAEDSQKAWSTYALCPPCIPFTKTDWTRDEVMRQAQVKSTAVGVSVDIDLFRPRPRFDREWPRRPLRVAAMIRPESAYRAPGLTMEILRRASRRYGTKIEIMLFGTEPNNPRFQALPNDFAWRLAGVLDQSHVAGLLNEADIFVDFSTHQAMGLTALEAMACGAAVVVPAKGGAASFARHEENSLIIDTASTEACWGGLERLIEDHGLRERLQRRALVDVCAFYPERAALGILNALFESSHPVRDDR